MKKLLLLPLLALTFFVNTPTASATDLTWADALGESNVKVKVEICHWASGNLSKPDVSINAVAGAQDTGHGLLTLNVTTGAFVSFVPHTETGGHEKDTVLRVYLKKGNDTVDLYNNPNGCLPEVPEVECPEGTTLKDGVCIKEVIKEIEKEVVKEVVKEVPVEKIVEKTVEVPGPTQVIEITREIPVPVAAPNMLPKPTPEAAPTGELPRTGGSNTLPIIGAGVTALGVALRRFFK